MSRLWAVLLLFLATPALGQQPVVVRTSVTPESGAVIGQRVAVFVDVLFAGEMPRPPRVVLPETVGAQILRFESQATTMSDRIDGQTYVGQRFEFALYARRGGTLTVGPAAVTLFDRAGGETGSAKGDVRSVAIAVPPGVDAGRPLIATRRAVLEEQWSPLPKDAHLKAGDALVRIVTREAEDVPAMAMPALAFAAPEGVRVYIDPPRGEDRQDRGTVTGRRIDKATYVFGAGGRFTLPGVEQRWWNLETGALRVDTLPDVTLSVIVPPAPPNPWGFWIPVVALLIVLILDAYFGPRLRAWNDARQARWLASEPKAFADLAEACRTDEPRAIYRALATWRRHVPDALVLPMAERLEQVLFAGDPWTKGEGRQLLAAAGACRSRRRGAVTALPPLNPA